MGDVIVFPINDRHRIRQAIYHYRKGELEMAVSLFSAIRKDAKSLEAFQDAVLAEFSAQHLTDELRQMMDELLYVTVDVERVMTLMEQFNDVLSQDFASEQGTPAVMPHALIEVLVHPDTLSVVEEQYLFQRLKAEAKIIGELELEEQMMFVQSVHYLPVSRLVDVFKEALLYPGLHFTIRSDILHTLLMIADPNDTVTLPDFMGEMETFSVGEMEPLESTAYYQRGRRYAFVLTQKDPFFEEALTEEWLLFCSFMFPFLAEEYFTTKEVIDFLYQLLRMGRMDVNQIKSSVSPELWKIKRLIDLDLERMDFT